MRERLVVGCMTGTSLDGLDVALVRITGTGLAMKAEVVHTTSRPFSRDTDADEALLDRLADGGPCDSNQIANAARWFSIFHAEAVGAMLRSAGIAHPDLICVHGQTVFHAPPLSWQLFNPWPLARAIGAPVVFDLRGADLAAGGQGAPITPLADWILFRRAERVVVVNLGGFCNITRLPGGDEADGIRRIAGRDVCACNQLLDAVARKVLGTPFDPDGTHAAAGRVHEEAVSQLQAVLESQSRAKRSLGTGDMAWEWIDRWWQRIALDLPRCAVEGIARVIARACSDTPSVMLAGGGCHNRVLVERIGALTRGPVRTTADAGVPIESREAVCMAILGALCQDRVPITLEQVTGAPPALAGCWAFV